MKTRDFDVLNYNIINAINKYVEENMILPKIGDEIQINLSRYSTFDIKLDKQTIMYGEKEKLFNALDKKVQDYIIIFYKKEYEEKTKTSIEQYNKIKKQTDFIFFDDKEYQELCKVLENAYYCQATIALSDFMDKKLKSKATKNIKYSIRNQEYMNISCD